MTDESTADDRRFGFAFEPQGGDRPLEVTCSFLGPDPDHEARATLVEEYLRTVAGAGGPDDRPLTPRVADRPPEAVEWVASRTPRPAPWQDADDVDPVHEVDPEAIPDDRRAELADTLPVEVDPVAPGDGHRNAPPRVVEHDGGSHVRLAGRAVGALTANGDGPGMPAPAFSTLLFETASGEAPLDDPTEFADRLGDALDEQFPGVRPVVTAAFAERDGSRDDRSPDR